MPFASPTTNADVDDANADEHQCKLMRLTNGEENAQLFACTSLFAAWGGAPPDCTLPYGDIVSWLLEVGELDASVDPLVWNNTYIGADGAERGFKTAFKYVTKHSYPTVAKFITALQEGFSMATTEEKADGSIKHADLFNCSAWNPAADAAQRDSLLLTLKNCCLRGEHSVSVGVERDRLRFSSVQQPTTGRRSLILPRSQWSLRLL